METVETIKFKCEGDFAPTRGTPFAAGIDLYNNGNDIHLSRNGSTAMINTLTSVEIPEGFVGLVFPRSSYGVKGMRLRNSTGVIDSDYRGHIKVFLTKDGNDSLTIKKGDRFAQMVIVPCLLYDIELVEELSDTERGMGGFGSTGK